MPADVVTVPRTAVTYSLYGDSVYVVKPAPARDAQAAAPALPRHRASRPSRRSSSSAAIVRTGQVRDDRVAITFGLAKGEEVVTTGQLKLNPGASIRIDNTQPLKPARRAAEAIEADRQCPSPTSSSAARCSPPW